MICDEWNYTLEIQSSSFEVVTHPIAPQQSNLFCNLSENREYYFRVVVSNAVGSVSSSDRHFSEFNGYYIVPNILYIKNIVLYHIDTTDVQQVTVILVKNRDGFLVQCDFIPGSEAQGCMVVLVGELDNTTVKLMRVDTVAMEFINVTCPPINYIRVIGYDIESDKKSIGPLAVYGNLLFNNSMLCSVANHEMESTLSASELCLHQ